VRIERAKELLHETYWSITQICFDVGFNDLTHFERMFKSFVGVTPSVYRKENGRKSQKMLEKRQQGPSERLIPKFIFA
jgi:AraC-like DNA-binding protein